MNTFRGKILVIRGGAIGDFILTLPAIAALRQQFPHASIEILGYPHIVQLAGAAHLVDHIRSIEARPLAGFFARSGNLAEELTAYFSEFDVILSYLYDPDLIFQQNVGRCSAAQFIAAPHRPEPGCRVHATAVYLKPLERLAIFDPDPLPRLRIEAAGWLSRIFNGGQGEPNGSVPVLALHPGSGGERKNWPEEAWARLLELLMVETRFNVLLVGGEAEGERLQRLAAALPPVRTGVAQSLPLARLAELLAECRGFVGHDSGISHLAAALGLPGLVLWGPTEEAVWRPLSERFSTVRHPSGLQHLSVRNVFDRVRQLWGPAN